MFRYYSFADNIIEIKAIPNGTMDGEYLLPFCCKSSMADLKITIQQKWIKYPAYYSKKRGRNYFKYNGKTYSVHEFSYVSAAVMTAIEDWKKEQIVVTVNPDIIQEKVFTVNQLLSLSGFTSGLLWHGCLTFHCSYICVGDRALLFAGASGAGKSTQAALWERYRGAEIINGDRALVWRREDGWYAGGISACGSSKICKNKTVKLAAIILLEQAEKNQILPMKAVDRYRAIVAGTAFHRCSREETEQAGQLAMNLITELPIYRLRNRADEEAVEVLEHVIGGILYDI